jgi:hypothetical protein
MAPGVSAPFVGLLADSALAAGSISLPSFAHNRCRRSAVQIYTLGKSCAARATSQCILDDTRVCKAFLSLRQSRQSFLYRLRTLHNVLEQRLDAN